MAREITINVIFDDEASVYVATSNDVVGLVAEAESFELLKQKVASLIPELVELNESQDSSMVPMELLVQERMQLAI